MISNSLKLRSLVGSLALITTCSLVMPSAHASGPAETALDAATLSSMELRAAIAAPRDRCFLYTELLHNWTEAAGRATAAGDDVAASAAMQHVDVDAAHLREAISHDAKRLKNAEELLDHSVHRLSDMLRVTSMDQHDTMQALLRHVSSVHDDLLAAVFAH